jgi:hypothetical protein
MERVLPFRRFVGSYRASLPSGHQLTLQAPHTHLLGGDERLFVLRSGENAVALLPGDNWDVFCLRLATWLRQVRDLAETPEAVIRRAGVVLFSSKNRIGLAPARSILDAAGIGPGEVTVSGDGPYITLEPLSIKPGDDDSLFAQIWTGVWNPPAQP